MGQCPPSLLFVIVGSIQTTTASKSANCTSPPTGPGLGPFLRQTTSFFLRSTFDGPTTSLESRTDGVASIALNLDVALSGFATGSTSFLQISSELLEKRPIARQTIHHGDGLSAAPGLLDPEPGDDPSRHLLVEAQRALALPRRPSARRANTRFGREDETGARLLAHESSLWHSARPPTRRRKVSCSMTSTISAPASRRGDCYSRATVPKSLTSLLDAQDDHRHALRASPLAGFHRGEQRERVGNVRLARVRTTVTIPYSLGCRDTSIKSRRNSGRLVTGTRLRGLSGARRLALDRIGQAPATRRIHLSVCHRIRGSERRVLRTVGTRRSRAPGPRARPTGGEGREPASIHRSVG